LKQRAIRAMIPLLDNLATFLYPLGSKYLVLDAFHMSNSCTIMYACEKSPPPHELSYIGRLFNFSLKNLFHVNVICRK
jgi:hypothetical protein